jgi:phage shock protein A
MRKLQILDEQLSESLVATNAEIIEVLRLAHREIKSLASAVDQQARMITECDEKIQELQSKLAESNVKSFPPEAAQDMYDFIASLENDLGQMPDFMWQRRNEILAKAEGKS